MATTNHIKANERRGAVIPLFGLLLPVLVMVAAFAINVAYMQLTTTELRVATDAAARAGGRAWSEYQSIDDAKEFAVAAAANNIVAGAPLLLEMSDGLNEIEFGLSRRADNGYGRYEFTKKPTPDVAAGTTEATSIRITGRSETTGRDPALFRCYLAASVTCRYSSPRLLPSAPRSTVTLR